MSKKLSTREYSYTVVYEPLKEGGYQVTVPVLPGLVTYGRTFEEAQAMARDAVLCHVEGVLKEKQPIPSEFGLLQEKITLAI